MAAKITRLNQGPPLPVPREDARVVAVGVELVEDTDGAGAVFVWGNAAWCWQAGDAAGRRLTAVQMVSTAAASQREVAAAFGVNETTVWRWRSEYGTGGVTALAVQAKGPRRASKLTEDKIAEIVAVRGEGLSMQAVADRVGVSLNSVSRALRGPGASAAPNADPAVAPEDSAAATTADDAHAPDAAGDDDPVDVVEAEEDEEDEGVKDVEDVEDGGGRSSRTRRSSRKSRSSVTRSRWPRTGVSWWRWPVRCRAPPSVGQPGRGCWPAPGR